MNPGWTPKSDFGVAIHNWHGNIRHGLPLDVGDFVEIFEEYGLWFRGTCPTKPRAVGIFPKSYIHLKDLNKTDPVVAECTEVLRNWNEIWKRLFVERKTYKFTTLRKVMLSLLESRREILGATLTQDQTLELQLKIISKIDWGNRKLELDLVPRIGALAVDPQKIGLVSLYKVHVNSAQNAKDSSSRGTLRKAKKKIFSHHLYLCMRDFGHRLGDDAEIYFYLYDGNPARMRALSERFMVRISKNFPKNCTVFTDLGAVELGTDLYLVATVLRVGKILHAESNKKGDKSSNAIYRRPFGVGVLSLAEFVPFDNSVEPEEKEFSFKLFQCEEKDFHQLHELIIKKASGKFSPINVSSQNHYGVAISLKLLFGALSQAKLEQPLLFEGTTLTRKMGFPDIIMPGDVRNDLFLSLEKGEFERGGKSTAKNIEVSVCVLDPNGKALNQCLFSASGESCLNHRSMIIYHNNSPYWNETLRLSIDPDVFATAHIRFLFRHCSTRDKSEPKLFGFSFVRLMETNGATLADDTHELYVYKCEDPAKLTASTYLKLPCSGNDGQAKLETSSLFHRSGKEMFFIKTLLCSTKLTQNSNLLHLLQWQSDKENITETLTRVLRLRDEELVKFLQDVLDALFAMFSNEEGNSTAHSGLVFHVLVSIFSLLQSSKFQHFKPIIDEYIEKHFAAALVYKGLLTSIQHCADWMTSADKPEPIQKCFESLEYIFKLIIQSRKLFARATGGQFEDSFRRDLFTVFQSLNQLLTITSYDKILPSQEALLSNLNVALEQLKNVISYSEVGTLASNMLDSVPLLDAEPRLIVAKLQAVKALVSGELFHDEDLRSLILSIACKHLRIHLVHRDELKLCAEIISEILIRLYDVQQQQLDKATTIQHDLTILCTSVLDVLLKTIIIIIEGSPAVLASLVAVTLGLLQQLDETHYKNLWDEITACGDYKEMKDFLHRSLLVFKELLTQNWQVFPNDWLVMKMAANDIVRKALEEFAKPLIFRFLGQYSFDSQLWWAYFSLAVTFLTQSCLQLECYHEAKRRKILNSHGDMRVLMGFQILSMWSQLGEHKLHFIPSMVGPFLEITLVPEPALRKATITQFYDILECEQLSRGSFRLVESELIDKLDLLINENKGDESFRELFSTFLMARVQEENPVWKEAGIAFISSVTRLLERLLDYRSVMQGDENRDKRMSCTVNLLNFYKNEINRKEMYLRYIYKLHDLHISTENYTEAGFTLKLYADMLCWDKETLTFAPGDNLGQQSGLPEWQRKENLYHEIIAYFDKGKCWENGVPLCKELANLYEKKFDYNSLSEILITEAKFFQNILIQIRPEPEYFRVGFYGNGFPSFVRNKQFIYRGLEYERLQQFTQRLQTEFPQAQILTKNCPPEAEILTSPDQYIQISNVRPISDPIHLCHATVVVPEKIARYYEVNDITRFQHDRPVYKGVIDKENEFKSLWIERIIMDISFPLPGILRWFEVCSRYSRELTPVEFACETMNNVNKELHDLISQYQGDAKRNINPFSMRLQGIIDANVMGGISKYQEAFFTDEFAKSEGKGQSANVQKLKCLILEQMKILDIALDLHGKICNSGVQPLHKRLKERYAQLKQNSEGLGRLLKRQHSESIVNTPLPPIPLNNENRTHSLGHQSQSEVLYEKDEIYTHLSGSISLERDPTGNKETLLLPEIANVSEILVAPSIVPPIPTRPKSAGHISLTDSPEVPPKTGTLKDKNAPPLPPRGLTNEKRASGSGEFDQMIPSIPARRSHKYSVVDISIEGSFVESDLNRSDEILNDYRDSGLSLGSGHELGNLNNLNLFDECIVRSHLKTNSNPEILNILSNDPGQIDFSMEIHSYDLPSPPPIPPK